MKPLIVANWKMNPLTAKEAKHLLSSLKGNIIVCPPFLYLPFNSKVKIGAQNCFLEQKGAFTGEISPKMLKNMGCQYVILGHSERRKYFNESNEIINRKIKAALQAKLKPILCVGEKKGENPKTVLEKQLKECLKGVKIKDIIIAYEPVWAIGTGKTPKVEEIETIGILIRKILKKNIPILYGGSVNSKNARAFVKETRMDGLLIGGASLDKKEFLKIIKKVYEN